MSLGVKCFALDPFDAGAEFSAAWLATFVCEGEAAETLLAAFVHYVASFERWRETIVCLLTINEGELKGYVRYLASFVLWPEIFTQSGPNLPIAECREANVTNTCETVLRLLRICGG